MKLIGCKYTRSNLVSQIFSEAPFFDHLIICNVKRREPSVKISEIDYNVISSVTFLKLPTACSNGFIPLLV